MFKVTLLAALIAFSAADLTATPTQDFVNGFFDGIGAKGNLPGTCSASLISLTNAIYTVADDFKVKNQNMQDVINTLNAMQAVVTTYNSAYSCDFASLNTQLKKILSKGGWEILVQNYLTNGQAIFQDYQTIMNCASNYYNCGKAYGDAFEKLVGWSLN
jgi:hypothetical protein